MALPGLPPGTCCTVAPAATRAAGTPSGTAGPPDAAVPDTIPPPDTTFGWRRDARLLRTVSATQPRHEESPLRYEIHVEGQIGASRSEWFDGMHITSGPDGTTIAGEVADQSALHGLLDRVRDFGLTVVSVTRVDRHPEERS